MYAARAHVLADETFGITLLFYIIHHLFGKFTPRQQ